jgi:uncharacterized integral membrane protein
MLPAAVADQPQTGGGKRERISWRVVAFAALAVYGVLLVILNSKQVEVSFVFFSKRASLVVVLLLALAIGFLAGFLFDAARERRRRPTSGSTS